MLEQATPVPAAMPSAAGKREENIVGEKSALITGVTGQDGAYLAELLLGKC